jgi:hypothetical protein
MITTHDGTSTMAVEPRIVDGRTYLPINSMELGLNAVIDWNTETETIEMMTALDEELTIVEKDVVTFAGDPYILEQQLIIDEEIDWIPLRSLAEIIGWNVSYNADKHEITLTY